MKKTTTIIASVIMMLLCITAFSGCNDNENNKQDENYFTGDSGISALAEISENSLGYANVDITIVNNTEKEIAAIKFYIVPFDVYGEEISHSMIVNEINTDTAIPAGGKTKISKLVYDTSVKTAEIYAYSVYFSDGTEWGNHNAEPSAILNYAPTLTVVVKS